MTRLVYPMSNVARGALAIIGAEVVLAGSFVIVGATGGLHGTASADTLQEDDPGWSCVTDGNRVCGPDNANGVAAGCYSDTGVLVSVWPCHVVVNPDGSADVYSDRPVL